MSPAPPRFHGTRDLHFITFSCCHRLPLLGTPQARSTFEQVLERVRQWYGMFITGYVVMPEHVHLLVGEPERSTLAIALQMLKQNVARELGHAGQQSRFWQRRYYDFNVWTEEKRLEKLKYIHRNPVTRGLVSRPEDWAWSSFRHWATGEESVVEIESQWTARKRDGMGLHLTVKFDESSRRTLP
ncbi:MAG TPA: transposase [Terriglobales bacterium]|nr:transposase [Terriglobales bacterium]